MPQSWPAVGQGGVVEFPCALRFIRCSPLRCFTNRRSQVPARNSLPLLRSSSYNALVILHRADLNAAKSHDPKNCITRDIRLSISANSHSHTTIDLHPSFRSFDLFSESRSRFLWSFGIQYSKRLLGNRPSTQLECWCQKHPCTRMTFLRAGKTISGRPGSVFTCFRNLRPD